MNMKNLNEKAGLIIDQIEEQLYGRPRASDQEPDSLLIGYQSFCILKASAEAQTNISFDEKGFTVCGLRGYTSTNFDSVHVFKKEPAL